MRCDVLHCSAYLFFFNDPAPPETYPLPLPAPLPICREPELDTIVAPATPLGRGALAIVRIDGPGSGSILEMLGGGAPDARMATLTQLSWKGEPLDRKSPRLNSSHRQISYAVFCLKNTVSVTARRTSRCSPHSRMPRGRRW